MRYPAIAFLGLAATRRYPLLTTIFISYVGMLIKISQKTTYEHNTAQANTDDHYEFTIIYTAAQANTIQSIDSYTGY